MAFQISPGVSVSEVDLTTVVPAVSTTAGAFVGEFQWGPTNKRTLVTNETELVSLFGEPAANVYTDTANTGVAFFTAANFLAYGTNLTVVRATTPASSNNATSGFVPVSIQNEEVYDNGLLAVTSSGNFAARYTGRLGNSLNVAVLTAQTSETAYNSWLYKSNFPGAPSTTPFVASFGGSYDQMHIVVTDEDGLFTGTKGTILETFPYVSQATDAQYDDGTPSYWRTVIRNTSKYIYALPNTTAPFSANTDQTAREHAGTAYLANNATYTHSLVNGLSSCTQADVMLGWDLFKNKDEIDVSLLITGEANNTVQNYVTAIARDRMDCVAFVSPPSANVVGVSASTAATNVANWAKSLNSTSYAFADSGWKYQFDKYNNIYRWVPLNGDMAGLCVRTDETRDPWFSPAGYSRGAVKNVVKLAWNPNGSQRDTIYSAAVNPVISQPGQGTILFGDKTLTVQPSAFNRINVRRLFIILEKSISDASKYSLFELNDEFTRSQFIALIEPFLRDVKGRRGIYDYRIVCDKTNNTQQIIDTNKFVGDIYIKPARSINFIQLNFVAVRSGVQFSEIVGSV